MMDLLRPYPTANKELWRQHAEAAAEAFKEYSALKIVECWGNDVPEGRITSFPMTVKCKNDEKLFSHRFYDYA